MPDRVIELPVSNGDAGPYGITTGADGALWITLVHAGAIARLGADQVVSTVSLDAPGCGPTMITAGPDGALWFTRSQDHRIGRLTTDGRATAYELPTPRPARTGSASALTTRSGSPS